MYHRWREKKEAGNDYRRWTNPGQAVSKPLRSVVGHGHGSSPIAIGMRSTAAGALTIRSAKVRNSRVRKMPTAPASASERRPFEKSPANHTTTFAATPGASVTTSDQHHDVQRLHTSSDEVAGAGPKVAEYRLTHSEGSEAEKCQRSSVIAPDRRQTRVTGLMGVLAANCCPRCVQISQAPSWEEGFRITLIRS